MYRKKGLETEACPFVHRLHAAPRRKHLVRPPFLRAPSTRPHRARPVPGACLRRPRPGRGRPRGRARAARGARRLRHSRRPAEPCAGPVRGPGRRAAVLRPGHAGRPAQPRPARALRHARGLRAAARGQRPRAGRQGQPQLFARARGRAGGGDAAAVPGGRRAVARGARERRPGAAHAGRRHRLRRPPKRHGHQDRHRAGRDAAGDLGDQPPGDGCARRADRDRGAALRARRGDRDLRPRLQGLRLADDPRLQRPGHQRLPRRAAPGQLQLRAVPHRALRHGTHRGAARHPRRCSTARPRPAGW